MNVKGEQCELQSTVLNTTQHNSTAIKSTELKEKENEWMNELRK